MQQRVLADGAVLEERASDHRRTPLMLAIARNKPAIALWLIEHRGQHDLDTADVRRLTAPHHASRHGPLEVVQALLAAGANPAALTRGSWTPLICASANGRTDIVAFLLQLPPVRISIDAISQDPNTALSCASRYGLQPVVQLLLNAGADPTLPVRNLPLNLALHNNHHTIAAVLGHAITEPDRARALHKVRCLLDAGVAQLACLRGRVERGQALPQLGFTMQGRTRNEELREVTALAVGVSGGEKDSGLCDELYKELLEYMLPAWADNPCVRFRKIARVEERIGRPVVVKGALGALGRMLRWLMIFMIISFVIVCLEGLYQYQQITSKRM